MGSQQKPTVKYYAVKPNRAAAEYDDFPPNVFTDWASAQTVITGKKNHLASSKFSSIEAAWDWANDVEEAAGSNPRGVPMPAASRERLERKQSRLASERAAQEQQVAHSLGNTPQAEQCAAVAAPIALDAQVKLRKLAEGSADAALSEPSPLGAAAPGSTPGALDGAPTGASHPFLSAVHAVAGSVSDLRDIVLSTRSDIQELRSRMSAFESSSAPVLQGQLAISEPHSAPPSAPLSLAEPPLPATSASLNPAAPAFSPITAPNLQQPALSFSAVPTPTNQLKLTCLPGFSFRGPSTVFLSSELDRIGLTVPQNAGLNWVSKQSPWRILTITFPDIPQAGSYLNTALYVLQQLGAAASFSIEFFQPSAQFQAQQRGARSARLLADGAEQAQGPVAAALEVVNGWMREGQAPQPDAVQQLASMLRSST